MSQLIKKLVLEGSGIMRVVYIGTLDKLGKYNIALEKNQKTAEIFVDALMALLLGLNYGQEKFESSYRNRLYCLCIEGLLAKIQQWLHLCDGDS